MWSTECTLPLRLANHSSSLPASLRWGLSPESFPAEPFLLHARKEGQISALFLSLSLSLSYLCAFPCMCAREARARWDHPYLMSISTSSGFFPSPRISATLSSDLAEEFEKLSSCFKGLVPSEVQGRTISPHEKGERGLRHRNNGRAGDGGIPPAPRDQLKWGGLGWFGLRCVSLAGVITTTTSCPASIRAMQQ